MRPGAAEQCSPVERRRALAGLLCWTEAVAGRTGVVVAVGTGICVGALGASTERLGAVAGTVIRCPCVRPWPLFAAL